MNRFESNILYRYRNKSAAARALRVSRATIQRRCRNKKGLTDDMIREMLDSGAVPKVEILAVMDGVRELPDDIMRRLKDEG